ncbi:MAG: DUF507 family protein [bacterium]|nr:DUF507 family protein [bacterium]
MPFPSKASCLSSLVSHVTPPKIMKMKKEQILRLAGRIARHLKERGMTFPAGEEAVVHRIERVVTQNFEEEEGIERQARQMMEKLQMEVSAGKIDPHKMYIMIKKQIAKEKKFIL